MRATARIFMTGDGPDRAQSSPAASAEMISCTSAGQLSVALLMPVAAANVIARLQGGEKRTRSEMERDAYYVRYALPAGQPDRADCRRSLSQNGLGPRDRKRYRTCDEVDSVSGER